MVTFKVRPPTDHKIKKIHNIIQDNPRNCKKFSDDPEDTFHDPQDSDADSVFDFSVVFSTMTTSASTSSYEIRDNILATIGVKPVHKAVSSKIDYEDLTLHFAYQSITVIRETRSKQPTLPKIILRRYIKSRFKCLAAKSSDKSVEG